MSERFWSISACAWLIIMLAGCATTGPYPFDKPGEKKAWVKWMGVGSISMCKDSQYYSLVPMAGSTLFEIPAGSEISVGHLFSHTPPYRTHYRCFPRIAFVPQEGKHYIMDGGFVDNACFVHVAREDERTPTGLAFEMTLRRSTCYQAKPPSGTAAGMPPEYGSSLMSPEVSTEPSVTTQ